MATRDDPFDLERFVAAQAQVWDDVAAELGAAAKSSHWMWFVFPQWRGLGRSGIAQRYGIASAAEALAYWRHPVLGPRLAQCLAWLDAAPASRSAEAILGGIDALKLRSSLTLFEAVLPAAEREPFAHLLERFHRGVRDPLTLAWLARPRDSA